MKTGLNSQKIMRGWGKRRELIAKMSKNEHRARNYPNKTGNMRYTLRHRIDTGTEEIKRKLRKPT